jgi:hypothetical protein
MYTVTTHAASDLTYYMEPSTKSALFSGDEFDIAIKLKSQTQNKILTTGFALTYNANILEVVSSQITPGESFTQTVENTIDSGSIKFTSGNASFVDIFPASDVTVATIPFKVKNTATSQITQLVFSNDTSLTTVLADDGETELLNSIESFDVIISKININITPTTASLNQGDTQEFTLSLSNPDKKDIITAEAKIIYDQLIFEPTSDTIDTTNTNFDFVIDKDVKNGFILFSGGAKGTEPANSESIILGKLSLKVKDNAPDTVYKLAFDKDSTNVYIKNDVSNNMIAKYSDGEYTIGNVAALDTTAPIVTANPGNGNYNEAINVTLTTNETATIFYALNNTEAKENFTTYSSPIAITQTTDLRYYAKDTAGNESQITTQSYFVGKNYTLSIVSTKDIVNAGEKVVLTATLNDLEGNPIANKTLLFTATSGESITKTTNTNGKAEIDFVLENTDTDVNVSLQDDATIKDTITLKVNLESISTVTIISDQIDNTQDDVVNVTIKNANGNPVANTSVKLTTSGKTYTGTTNTNGIAQITIPANDLSAATYSFIAEAGGIQSSAKSIVVIGNNSENSSSSSPNTVNQSRPGGGYTPNTPTSGPKETALIFLIVSSFIAWKINTTKEQL